MVLWKHLADTMRETYLRLPSQGLSLKYACEARCGEETVIHKSRQKQNKLQIQSEEDKEVKDGRAAVNPNEMCRCRGSRLFSIKRRS